jgi:hypothetical protein
MKSPWETEEELLLSQHGGPFRVGWENEEWRGRYGSWGGGVGGGGQTGRIQEEWQGTERVAGCGNIRSEDMKSAMEEGSGKRRWYRQ